jgi:hypothetical protein
VAIDLGSVADLARKIVAPAAKLAVLSITDGRIPDRDLGPVIVLEHGPIRRGLWSAVGARTIRPAGIGQLRISDAGITLGKVAKSGTGAARGNKQRDEEVPDPDYRHWPCDGSTHFR